MTDTTIRTDAYFDGETLFQDGPYRIEVRAGRISAIRKGNDLPEVRGEILTTAFLMPGLVDGHVHMFLNGGDLDFASRKAHLATDFDTMMAVARDNVTRTTRAGVTLARDAGDRFGVNTATRAELMGEPDRHLTLRSAGTGLKSPKRYGGFLARDLTDFTQVDAMVGEHARHSDDLKIVLTGIIDFEQGAVKGAPQFELAQLRALVRAARAHGLKTLAHCSGQAGLKLAVAAGIGSVEHGFFMSRDILTRMADQQIAWVATFAPVFFQWSQPEHAGWDHNTVGNLRRILDNHHEHVALAAELGVPLVAGSDAGSFGVAHGGGLIGELQHMLASGLSLQQVLRAATSVPRQLWSMKSANIRVGNEIDAVGLKSSPVHDIASLGSPAWTFKTGTLMLN
jgi:imidazolonepropionase-like amidohydrolase